MKEWQPRATVLIVPGLRDHMEDHWQTRLAAGLDKVVTVPPLTSDRLSCQARVEAIAQALATIEGPVILVAHSAGVLMVAHWVAQYADKGHTIAGVLLVTPPDLDVSWPAPYPSQAAMMAGGWQPLPRARLPFPSLMVMSQNDPLASPAAVRALAGEWGSELVDAGAVGHLNPASGFGPWPLAWTLLARLGA
ncbi:RBBP9/YdeN family alpha/beta hydrolase [Aeromonas lusitana]|uniref:Alpha/beta hydrolase n=1 Tax=Aeromonas lusitana TaxID=931529 RepID=A0A2M8HCD3_9GAMM|nr:alpha/beta hydrolase [Aeromonas lusitana]PJC94219.1 alpha/beta hydrolase [Aeromonas lusitana]